jgi:hypothetical protein
VLYVTRRQASLLHTQRSRRRPRRSKSLHTRRNLHTLCSRRNLRLRLRLPQRIRHLHRRLRPRQRIHHLHRRIRHLQLQPALQAYAWSVANASNEKVIEDRVLSGRQRDVC